MSTTNLIDVPEHVIGVAQRRCRITRFWNPCSSRGPFSSNAGNLISRGSFHFVSCLIRGISHHVSPSQFFITVPGLELSLSDNSRPGTGRCEIGGCGSAHPEKGKKRIKQRRSSRKISHIFTPQAASQVVSAFPAPERGHHSRDICMVSGPVQQTVQIAARFAITI